MTFQWVPTSRQAVRHAVSHFLGWMALTAMFVMSSSTAVDVALVGIPAAAWAGAKTMRAVQQLGVYRAGVVIDEAGLTSAVATVRFDDITAYAVRGGIVGIVTDGSVVRRLLPFPAPGLLDTLVAAQRDGAGRHIVVRQAAQSRTTTGGRAAAATGLIVVVLMMVPGTVRAAVASLGSNPATARTLEACDADYCSGTNVEYDGGIYEIATGRVEEGVDVLVTVSGDTLRGGDHSAWYASLGRRLTWAAVLLGLALRLGRGRRPTRMTVGDLPGDALTQPWAGFVADATAAKARFDSE